LRCTPGLVQADFLAFHLPGIAGYEPRAA